MDKLMYPPRLSSNVSYCDSACRIGATLVPIKHVRHLEPYILMVTSVFSE